MGGFELACYNLSKGLIAAGHEVLVLTSPTELLPPEPQPFVERVLNMAWPPPFPAASADLARTWDHLCQVSQLSNTQIILERMREFRPDRVLMFGLIGLGGLAIIDAVDASGVSWTMNLGDRVPSQLLERIPEDVLDIYDAGSSGRLFSRGRYSAVSQTLADEIVGEGVDLGDDIAIIPRGVVLADVPRTRPYRDKGVSKFVSAGALHPHKGVDITLEAISVLDHEGRFEFSVDFYGDGMIEHYRERAAQLGIEHRVAFKGKVAQSDVIHANADADAFLFPTWEREPGASVAIEAAAAGALPILTGACGPAERMVHGIHCIKIDRSVSSLVDAMRTVGLGEIDLEGIGAAGRRLAAGDMSFATSVRRLENVLASKPARALAFRLDDHTLDAEVADKHERSITLLSERIKGQY